MDQSHISGTAVILTGGVLDKIKAKTAHGLIRGTERFDIVGVIDENFAGQDAGMVIDKKAKNIPVVASIEAFLSGHVKPKFAIVGMATKGGILPKELYPVIKSILNQGIRIVNGLHEPIGEIPEFKEFANGKGEMIYDVRKSKPFRELHFWTGKVKEITATKLAVLGTDCATGKRTTSRLLVEALNAAGVKSEMIYTGQTGWMQGGSYGLFFDATANDFIPGEIEHALYSCWKEVNPKVMVLEGQSGLRNPSGPCGSEFIVSGAADGVILQHPPKRKKFNGLENYPADLPDLLDEIALIEKFGAPVLAVTVNTTDMSQEDIAAYRKEMSGKLKIPLVFPFYDSFDPIINVIKALK